MMNKLDEMYSSPSDSNIYVDIDNQSIHFNANICPKTMSKLIDELIKLESNILKKQKKLKRKLSKFLEKDDVDDDFDDFDININYKPIKLYITSNGGYVYQVFSAIDTIEGMTIPVHTICKGFVASAGTLMSLAGKKRYITKNTYMLIHEIRSGYWGKFTSMTESYENSSQLMDHIKRMYTTKTKLTEDELDEQLKKDISWSATMCLEKGLVDEII